MNHITKIAAALLLSTSTFSATATTYGYCTDNVNRQNIFRVGSTETQGTAIRLDSGKLAALKGQTITGVQAAFGSMRTTGGTVNLFITSDPTGAPITLQEATITGALKWIDYTLDTPYTITGDEGQLYIGYTAEISVKSSMLMADHAVDDQGCSYVYVDGAWTDTYGMGVGNVSLRIYLAEGTPLTDLRLKPIALDGYFKAENEYTLTGQVYNFGTEAINAFDINVQIGSGEKTRLSYTDLNIAQNSTYDFTLPTLTIPTEGDTKVTVEVAGINGGEDADATDNCLSSSIFCYPKDMERTLFVEGFTGQMCSNCPAGHSILEQWVEETGTDVVEVMHHSGYSPDYMTMDIDLDYTYFYGSASTYAPAVMVNRTQVPTIGTVPVMNVTAANLRAATEAIANTQPYLSMDMESSYDPDSRKVKATLTVHFHNQAPEGQTVVNAILTQDGIEGYQSPYGAGYQHNAVCRGALTGNAWGIALEPEMTRAGGESTWSWEFDLPESIFADYYNYDNMTAVERMLYTQTVVPENMYIVAYVGAYAADDVNGHTVYNAVRCPIDGRYTQGGMGGIEKTETETDMTIRVIDRRISVEGACDTLEVYTLSGMAVDSRAELAAGLYIARASKDGKSVVKKISVR